MDEVSAHLYLCVPLDHQGDPLEFTEQTGQMKGGRSRCLVKECRELGKRMDEGRGKRRGGAQSEITRASQVAQQSSFLLATVAPLPLCLDIKTFSLI